MHEYLNIDPLAQISTESVDLIVCGHDSWQLVRNRREQLLRGKLLNYSTALYDVETVSKVALP